VDRHRFDAEPDLTFRFDGDPDPNTTPVLHMFHKVAKKSTNEYHNYFQIPYFSPALALGSSEAIQGKVKPLDKSSTLSHVF
jgi:hypothetical protein